MVAPQAKILVVDDEVKNVKLLEALLTPRGYAVVKAFNGEEALRQVQQEQPDLILLDVMMPIIDGFEVCKILKDNAETRLIPVVIMTALGQVEDRIKGIEAGADDFLTKPVHRDELLARIRTSLRLKQAIERKLDDSVTGKSQSQLVTADNVSRREDEYRTSAVRGVQRVANPLDRLAGGVFVGRELEMDELRAGLEAALAGHGHLVLLVGEPGIGKTRTAHELVTYARLRGAQVLIGCCHEGDGAPPFWPWVQIVRSYVYERNPQALMAEMGPGAADIAQVISEVRERLPYLPPPPVLEPEQARFRFFDSLTTFLKNAAKGQPLVLILDDLHWADKPSLLLLQFLARELGETHLLVIGTYRDVELGRQHPLTQTLGELAREPVSQRILLRGLTARDIARFIEIAAGLTPPEALVAAIYKQTEGNPFFVNEIVRLLVTEGRLTHLEEWTSWNFAVPESVREVLGRRLNTLSEECSRVLTLASVIGREFGIDVLERVSNTAGDRLLGVLEEAMAARVITEVPQVIGRYSFSHALIRETLYEELATIHRVRLHSQISRVLEGLYSANPEPHLAELAYHFFEAVQGGSDVDKAIAYARRAGERATALLAYEEAAGHYERALQALELKKPDETQRCELLLALGDAQTRAGDSPKAKETFQRAADLARKLGEPEQLARAALGFGGGGVEVGIVDKLLVNLLEEALSALGEGDSALRARVLARLAGELYFSAASAKRRASLSQEAVEMARRVGDRAALAAALNSRRLALWEPENVEDRLATATEMVRLAEEVGDRERALQGHTDRLADLLELGDISAVDLEIETCARLAEELRQPRYLWNVATFRAMRALLEGRFEEDERLALQALAIGQRVQSQTTANFFGAQMFSLRREQGRLEELEAAVKGFVQQYPAVPAWRSALASLYSELGREVEARSEFEHLAANNFVDLPRDNSWLIGVTLLSEVCAFLADARRAATLYELLLPYAEHNVVVGDAAACNGSVSRNLGLLASTMARWKEAARHFEGALEMNVRMGARPFVARTQYEYAAMLLARAQSSDRERALELLDSALNIAQELGMKSLGDKAVTLKVEAQGITSGEIEASISPPVLIVEAERPAPRVPVASAGPIMGKSQSQPVAAGNVFHREGEYWTLAYQGTICRLKDAKGLHYIAFLLRHPSEEFHAVELVTAVGKQQTPPVPTTYGELSEEQLAEHNLSVGGLGDAGVLLDAQAKATYKRRLDELQEELEEAQRFNDPERTAKAQAEIDFLTDELAAAVGLGGRDRKAASAAERARLNITKAIQATLRKIGQNHAALGHHLATTIQTGTFCSYTPDPTHPIFWTL